jgi:hypothetical protein
MFRVPGSGFSFAVRVRRSEFGRKRLEPGTGNDERRTTNPNPEQEPGTRNPEPGTVAAAAVVATIAFWAYSRTLLPGVDLGDTGGFQAAVLWPDVSARQAYPLYYALARPFVRLTAPDNPARGLNLFSAVCAALAVGTLTFACARVSRSILAGIAAGLLFAFSYTWWTQAVIAEVYSLHLALLGVCLVALLAWSARPSTTRLAIVLAVYALGFGNHLGMILLLLPFAAFVLMTSTRPQHLFRPGVVALAAAIAAAGALQYLPNLLAVWRSVDAPESWIDRVAAFWFDVTKADWRESMVLGVSADQAGDRAAMSWFDARQQFGIIGLLLAAIGLVQLWRIARPWAALVASAYVINAMFALTYNVGDAYVFFLPGHFVTAFAAGAAVSSVSAPKWLTGVAAAGAIAYTGWRGFDTWPAVDRHDDRRGEQLVERLTLGLSEQHALFVSQLNWQVENAVLYAARFEKPALAWVRLADVGLHFPFLVRDNHQIGRDVVLTAPAAATVAAAYGPLFPLIPDEFPSIVRLTSIAGRLARGAPYVMALLPPPRDEYVDEDALAETLRTLTGGRPPARQRSVYEVVAGLVGETPVLYRSSSRPFRQQITLEDARFEIRMDSWLPTETFRRGGFGHVIRGRRHVLSLERGLNLVSFDGAGNPQPPYYAAGLYAAQPRFRIPVAVARLARAQAAR